MPVHTIEPDALREALKGRTREQYKQSPQLRAWCAALQFDPRFGVSRTGRVRGPQARVMHDSHRCMLSSRARAMSL